MGAVEEDFECRPKPHQPYDVPDDVELGSILELAGDTAPVHGLVVDKDGVPWAGAQIVVSGEHIEAMLLFTDETGGFSLFGLPRALGRDRGR